MTYKANEILLNASPVCQDATDDYFEFVVDDSLVARSCLKICFSGENEAIFVKNNLGHARDNLYELNHVRVNPKQDNSYIIACLTQALTDIGVNVQNIPTQDSIATLYKPMGEITDTVRFYVDEDCKLHFLSIATRKTLTCISNKHYDDKPWLSQR